MIFKEGNKHAMIEFLYWDSRRSLAICWAFRDRQLQIRGRYSDGRKPIKLGFLLSRSHIFRCFKMSNDVEIQNDEEIGDFKLVWNSEEDKRRFLTNLFLECEKSFSFDCTDYAKRPGYPILPNGPLRSHLSGYN